MTVFRLVSAHTVIWRWTPDGLLHNYNVHSASIRSMLAQWCK